MCLSRNRSDFLRGLAFLGFDDQLTLPRRADLYLLSEMRDMRKIRRAVFSSRRS